MKHYKLLLLIACLSLSGCNLFSSGPSSVVKKLMSVAESGDVDAMVSLWGSKAVQEQGADKIKGNAQNFASLLRTAREAGENMSIERLRETVSGDRARVFFLYRDSKGKDSIGMGFALIKEEGRWKLYRSIDISDEERPFDSSFAARTAPSPPAVTSSQTADPIAGSSGAPISGGILNAKAISLPQPAYPQTGTAVKASGKVVVQVTVDESGKVISATAVSGHPLLRASAVGAARLARFTPTLLSGKPVKVNGTLEYEFSPP